MEETYAPKKTNKGKVIAGAVLLAATLYAGEKLHVTRAVGDAFTGAKNGVVDIFTYDMGERADDIVKKMHGKRGINGYVPKIESMAYEAASHLPKDRKELVIEKIIKDSDLATKKDIFEYTAKDFGKEERTKSIDKIINESDAATKKDFFDYTAQSIGQEERSNFIQQHYNEMSIEQTKALRDNLDEMIYADGRAHATGLSKIKYKVTDFYKNIWNKVTGKSKKEPEAKVEVKVETKVEPQAKAQIKN